MPGVIFTDVLRAALTEIGSGAAGDPPAPAAPLTQMLSSNNKGKGRVGAAPTSSPAGSAAGVLARWKRAAEEALTAGLQLSTIQQLLSDADPAVVSCKDPQVRLLGVCDPLALALGELPPPPPPSEPVVDYGAPSVLGEPEAPLGARWLRAQCDEFLTTEEADALTCDVFTLLRSSGSDEAIQGPLVDLLGLERVALVTELVEQRDALVEAVLTAAPQHALEQLADEFGKGDDGGAPGDAGNRPTGPFLVQSQAEIEAQKRQRKEARRRQRAGAGPGSVAAQRPVSAALLGLGGPPPRETRGRALAPASETAAEKFPHVYVRADGGNVVSATGHGYALPAGALRSEYHDHEAIVVPAGERAGRESREPPAVTVEALPELAQRVFASYTTLNRIQSIVFPTAFESNENMLVCAPTGAGKTDVAMLAVLRCVEQHRAADASRRVLLDTFKIVYVAPMKALAAEVARKFAARLAPAGIAVRELTGDMQLTRREIQATQMLVVTPEKWDVVTRKTGGDSESDLAGRVRLLIIDEVHLLHDERGSVIEALVARTLRQVETQQSLIRIVGLSATLPNYVDVAAFLRVNPRTGLFVFDSRFRPVPLEQRFLGVRGRDPGSSGPAVDPQRLRRVVYDQLAELVRRPGADGASPRQVMVFVHSRKETVRTARALLELATAAGDLDVFSCQTHAQWALGEHEMARARHAELRELFPAGFGVHHAGLLRSDRTLVERMFSRGLLRVLVCTATLAWGVNLPAHAVVIAGTRVYDATRGGFVDLSILDVLQIFGRAGRPQFVDDHGIGVLVTGHASLAHYLGALTTQQPIESKLAGDALADALNAEIALGSVTSVDDALSWLGYTFLDVRMRRNPFQYGLGWEDVASERLLLARRSVVERTIAKLAAAQCVSFDADTGAVAPKDLGRVASQFYITHRTVQTFNEVLRRDMTHADALALVSLSSEFENVRARDEEVRELKRLAARAVCAVRGSPLDTFYGKTNVLLQAHVSRVTVDEFSLVSDMAYVAQNAGRILRAAFEAAVHRGLGGAASALLALCISVERRAWPFEHPLRQFADQLPADVLEKLERARVPVETLVDDDVKTVGALIRNHGAAKRVQRCASWLPAIELTASVQPLAPDVVRVSVAIEAVFSWNDAVHGLVEPWWVFCEDSSGGLLHCEPITLSRRQREARVSFVVPRRPSVNGDAGEKTLVRVVADRWLASEAVVEVPLRTLVLPTDPPSPATELLPLSPLPVASVGNPAFERILRARFAFFNPVQTQLFHTVYHGKRNVLVGAPTGSGKTVVAELALFAALRDAPSMKIVYVAPLKALVRERVDDWRRRLFHDDPSRLVELTGDAAAPGAGVLARAAVIITTPEKWDSVTRAWRDRRFVQSVGLVIMDEIHLLGGDRGPILEVLVSRMNHMGARLGRPVRLVGLSTALANANELADWLHAECFNFGHAVRPVPLQVYIDGFPGKHYCPRMQSMNRAVYAAINRHAPEAPTLVFVSSRRQTRLTAQALVTLCGLLDNPRRFCHMSGEACDEAVARARDPALRLTLPFGVGVHHAGLAQSDRSLVEELFASRAIQVLVATSTLAWGVNLPAHLVVVKGTEFYDAKTRAYVDMPLTDVLQMMGRAGRPQFDDRGVACILVHDVKKQFYKRFLHAPFPVESSLHRVLEDHLNAEVVAGTVTSRQDAVDYVSWTYLYRRLQHNPAYYGLAAADRPDRYVSQLVERAVGSLAGHRCVDPAPVLAALPLGRIAALYYVQCATVARFWDALAAEDPPADPVALLALLSRAGEFAEVPVRHNEDRYNTDLESRVRVPLVPNFTVSGPPPYDSPHAKAFLLLQAHLLRLPVAQLPCSDYETDLKSVLDQAVRVAQALVNVAAETGRLGPTLAAMQLVQALKQACFPDDFAGLGDSGPNRPVYRVSANLGSGKLAVDMVRETPYRLVGSTSPEEGFFRAHTPRFPKAVYEGWWLLLADRSTDAVLALKHVAPRRPDSRVRGAAALAAAACGRISAILDTSVGALSSSAVLLAISDCYGNLEVEVDSLSADPDESADPVKLVE